MLLRCGRNVGSWPITTFRCVAEFGRYRDNIGLSPAERPEDLWVHGQGMCLLLMTSRCAAAVRGGEHAPEVFYEFRIRNESTVAVPFNLEMIIFSDLTTPSLNIVVQANKTNGRRS
jgi:hypothetical protein